MLSKNGYKSHKNLLKYGLILAVLIVLAGGFIVWRNYHGRTTISKEIHKQLSFVPYIVKPYDGVSAPESIKYDNATNLLSYITYLNGTKIVISQQPTPESFSDVPQAYEGLMVKMRSLNTFDTVNGKVNITYPDELNGGQTAVMNSKGTLIFAKPDRKISVNDWKKYFNNLSEER